MKRIISAVLVVLMIAVLAACGSSYSNEETNAKTILMSEKATYKSDEEVEINEIKAVNFVKEQTVKNRKLTYFIVETDSYDWGYAELCDGSVLTYKVGYSESDAKTRCNDTAEYRTSELGAMAIN